MTEIVLVQSESLKLASHFHYSTAHMSAFVKSRNMNNQKRTTWEQLLQNSAIHRWRGFQFLTQVTDSSLFCKCTSKIKQKYPQEYYILDLLDLWEFLLEKVLGKKLSKSSFCSSIFYNTVLWIEEIIGEVLSFHTSLVSETCLTTDTCASGLWLITNSYDPHRNVV